MSERSILLRPCATAVLLFTGCYDGSESMSTTAGSDSSGGVDGPGDASADGETSASGSASASTSAGSASASDDTGSADQGSADAESSGNDSAADAESSSGGGDPIDVPTDNPYCADVVAWDPSWVAWEIQVLELVNAERATGGSCGGQPFGPSAPLEMQPNLRCAARVHSKDMNDRNFFDHTNPDGWGPGERAQEAGYAGAWVGENIAGGQQSPNEVMQSWMESPGHCSNILNPDYAWLGVGYYPGGQYGHLWTQVFGVP